MIKKCLPFRWLAVVTLFIFGCTHDYNPFDNYANANVVVPGYKGARLLHSGDTLPIFTTETLQVLTTVREKINSFRVTVTKNMNRNFTDSLFLPPFSADYHLPFSFYDTGWVSIQITTYRSNHDSVVLMPPIAVYVDSLRRQSDIDTVFDASDSLSTSPVGDDDVLYVWAFGKDTVEGITQNSIPIPYSQLRHVQVGQQDTGYLWVTDLLGKFRSPSTSFTYLFWEPSPPKIKCTNNGLSVDTVITSQDTLTIYFQVTDFSGQGIKSVTLAGDTLETNNGTYYKRLTGVSEYKYPYLKGMEIVEAKDGLNDSTIDTLYVRYDPKGLQGELVKFKLVNPSDTFLSTTYDTLLYILDVTNYSQEQISVGTAILRPNAVNYAAVGSVKYIADSTSRCVWVVPLGHVAVGATSAFDTIKTTATVPGSIPVETTIVVQRSAPAVDTPQILEITVNGKVFDPTKSYDTSAVSVAVLVVDNGSGIKTVAILDSTAGAGIGTVNKGTMVPVTDLGLGWWQTTAPIAFNLRAKLNLVITATNNILRSSKRVITVTKTPRTVITQ